MIVANNVKEKGVGSGADTNLVTFITKNESKKLPLLSKEKVGDELFNEIISWK